MTVDEQVAKLEAIAQNPSVSEASVHHMFTLGRKLVERLPDADRSNFALVKFYGDWTVHTKIDRSKVGAGVLQRVADIVFDQMKRTDTTTMTRDLTDALSFDRTREQLNELVVRFNGPPDLFTPGYWRRIVPTLAEIISSVPLTIAKDNRFQAFWNAIRAKPVRGTSVVEQLAVIKVPANGFAPGIPPVETFHIMITTTDTTKIVAALVR